MAVVADCPHRFTLDSVPKRDKPDTVWAAGARRFTNCGGDEAPIR